MGLGNRPGEPRRQGERNRQSIRHANYDITDGVSRSEVLLNVWGHGYMFRGNSSARTAV